MDLLIEFFQNFLNYFDYKIFSIDELITILLFYNFFKLLVFSSLVELIWPTQFFNKKNNIHYQIFRFRSYVEFILKLRSVNLFYRVFSKKLINSFFKKK
jgi:hypothetical protein